MKDINSLINKIQDQDSRNVRGGSGTTKKVLEKIVENLEQLNEAGFVTKDVDDLENYNTKTQEAEIYATKQQLGGYYTKEQTDAMLATLGNGSYVVAWDGSSEPVVANIPAGVTVTYGGTDYTGTLDASASTKENIYLVGQDMYITSVNDSTYSWLAAGTTELDLSGYATDAELSQLEAEVTDLQDGETVLQQQIDAIQPVVIEGNVTNAPDNEDIKADPDNRLKFKDRPATLTNKGYKILRADKTFASQVTDINTIYEIRYQFDINGGEVTIPTGCELRFIGGSIIDNAETPGELVLSGTILSGDVNISCWLSGEVYRGEIKSDSTQDISDIVKDTITNEDVIIRVEGEKIWHKDKSSDNQILLDEKKNLVLSGDGARKSKLVLQVDEIDSKVGFFKSTYSEDDGLERAEIRDVTVIFRKPTSRTQNLETVLNLPSRDIMVKDSIFVSDVNCDVTNETAGFALMSISGPAKSKYIMRVDAENSVLNKVTTGYHAIVVNAIPNTLDFCNPVCIKDENDDIVTIGYCVGKFSDITNALCVKAAISSLSELEDCTIEVLSSGSLGTATFNNNKFFNAPSALMGGGRNIRIVNNDFVNIGIGNLDGVGNDGKYHAIYIQGGQAHISGNKFKGGLSATQISFDTKQYFRVTDAIVIDGNTFENCSLGEIGFSTPAWQENTLASADAYMLSNYPEGVAFWPHGYSVTGRFARISNNVVRFDYELGAIKYCLLVRINTAVSSLIDEISYIDISGNTFIGAVGDISIEHPLCVPVFCGNTWVAPQSSLAYGVKLNYKYGLIFKNNIVDLLANSNAYFSLREQDCAGAKYCILEGNHIYFKGAGDGTYQFVNSLVYANSKQYNNDIKIPFFTRSGANSSTIKDSDGFLAENNSVKCSNYQDLPENTFRDGYKNILICISGNKPKAKVFNNCDYDFGIQIIPAPSSKIELFNKKGVDITTTAIFEAEWEIIRARNFFEYYGLVFNETRIGFYDTIMPRNKAEKLWMLPRLNQYYDRLCSVLGAGTLTISSDALINRGNMVVWGNVSGTLGGNPVTIKALVKRGDANAINNDEILGVVSGKGSASECQFEAVFNGDGVLAPVSLNISSGGWNRGDIIVPETASGKTSMFKFATSIPDSGVYGIMEDSGVVASDQNTYNSGDVVLHPSNKYGYTAVKDGVHTYKSGSSSGYALMNNASWIMDGCYARLYRLSEIK